MSCLPAHGGAGKQLESSQVPDVASADASTLDRPGHFGDSCSIELLRRTYLPFLDRRIQEIAQAIREGQIEECTAQLFTLETSAHMLGADEVSLRAAALRLAVMHHQPTIGVLITELTRSARVTLEGIDLDAEGAD